MIEVPTWPGAIEMVGCFLLAGFIAALLFLLGLALIFDRRSARQREGAQSRHWA